MWGPDAAAFELVEVRYSAAEIDALDRAARRNRQGSVQFVNFDGLPEILRALGHRVDLSNGRFAACQQF